MKIEDQIRVLAELDGLVRRQALNDTTWAWFRESKRITEWTNAFNQVEGLPAYLTSYDAIIPLIQKQSVDVKLAVDRECFESGLLNSFEAKPDFLCEALIRATGKWIE